MLSPKATLGSDDVNASITYGNFCRQEQGGPQVAPGGGQGGPYHAVPHGAPLYGGSELHTGSVDLLLESHPGDGREREQWTP